MRCIRTPKARLPPPPSERTAEPSRWACTTSARTSSAARCSGTSCRRLGDPRLRTSYVGRDINEGRAGEEHTHGYTIYDLTAQLRHRTLGRFSLGVENLTDKFYFLSFSQIDFFRNYFAGRGRTVSLTHMIDF